MNGDEVGATIMLGLAAGLVLWAALVLWAQIRLCSERRLRQYAMRRAAKLGLRDGFYLVTVDRRRARTTLTWRDDENIRVECHTWRNRMDTR